MSSSSGSLAVSEPHRRVQSDVFRPKFPLNPFVGPTPGGQRRSPLRDPWFLRLDSLQFATACSRRQVIFVLGAPSLKDLTPILQSSHLAHSLVILATHQPPDISHITIPTLRILRLSSPLAIEDTGAVRFVKVLEWAERVARVWRKIGGSGILELPENDDDSNMLSPPPVVVSRSAPSSRPSSASSSPPSRPTSVLRMRQDSHKVLTKPRQAPLPPMDPSQRPFDALINFLPENVSDKAMLKQTILVTTISRPFLVANAPAITMSDVGRTRRRSIFNPLSNSSRSSVYLPATAVNDIGDVLAFTAPPGKAHLVHLLPSTSPAFSAKARARLVETVEPFVLSFSSPGAGDSRPSDANDRVRPYILDAAAFAAALNSTGTEHGSQGQPEPKWGQWAVADAVLSGALDGSSTVRRRAWISTLHDVVLLPALEDRPVSPASIVIVAPPLSPRQMSKQRADSDASLSDSSPIDGNMGRRTSPRKPQPHGTEGLPTPPDSDDSGEEGARRPSESDTHAVESSELGVLAPAAIAANGTKLRKSTRAATVRWSFWRKDAVAR